MTQNLRSTDVTHVTNSDGTTTTAKPLEEMQGWSVSWNYTYPGSSDNGDERKAALIADPELLKAYGLLYNWEAASGRIYDPQINEENKPDQQQYRGVCPDGWHLPSD